MHFEWTKKPVVWSHWSQCEQMMLAENRYAYLVGREHGQWFAMHQDHAKVGEYWLHYADSLEDAKRLAEEHARGRLQ